MIIQNIIPDKVLFVKFKRIGSGCFRPEYKALSRRKGISAFGSGSSSGIKPPGIIAYSPAGAQFPQIYPAGPIEGNFHQLAHRSPDNPGKNDPLIFPDNRWNSGGRLRDGPYRHGNRLTGDDGRRFFFRSELRWKFRRPNKRGRRRGLRGLFNNRERRRGYDRR
jgi:hypothetical protein